MILVVKLNFDGKMTFIMLNLNASAMLVKESYLGAKNGKGLITSPRTLTGRSSGKGRDSWTVFGLILKWLQLETEAHWATCTILSNRGEDHHLDMHCSLVATNQASGYHPSSAAAERSCMSPAPQLTEDLASTVSSIHFQFQLIDQVNSIIKFSVLSYSASI